ncbi:MAG: hypothetical protein ACOYBQ_00035 [Fluviibacter sp.]
MEFTLFLFVLVIALMAAIGAALLLVGYIVVIPASVVRSWWWAALVILVPILGPIFFCRAYPEGLRKTRLQIMIGTLLLIGAAAMLYGGGPWIVERMIDTAKTAG